MRYRLRDIVEALEDAVRVVGDVGLLETPFDGLSTDSRTVVRGNLFVALRGERFDGHDFVEQAFEKGAVAAVVNRDWAETWRGDKPVLAVEDPLKALMELARFHRRHFDIPVVALTGTVGKTTAKEMIAAVLSRRFKVLKNPSSYNNAIGVSLTLAQLGPEHEMAVCELGTNHRGEIAELAAVVEPSVGLVLNVGRGHLEFLGSVEGVREEKYDLLRWLADHGRGPAFLNADEPMLRAKPPEGVRVVWYGQDPTADVRVSVIDVDAGHAVVRFLTETVRLPVPGAHHVSNAAAAVAVGLHFGLSPQEIANGLANATIAAHRGQMANVAGVTLIDDAYNCNPESARAALRLLASLPARRRVFVFGDMLELGEVAEREHRSLGRELKDYGVDALFAFGALAARTAEEARRSGVLAFHFEDKGKLVDELVAMVGRGDAVLFKGSRGMRMEEAYEALRKRLGEATGSDTGGDGESGIA